MQIRRSAMHCFWWMGLVALLISPSLAQSAPVDFEKSILPVFESKCFQCHSGLTVRPKAGIRLDTKKGIETLIADQLIIPGDPDSSYLLDVMTLPIGDEALMPPAGKGQPIDKNQARLFHDWIKQGASVGSWEKATFKESQLVSGLGTKKVSTEVQAAADQIDKLVAQLLDERGLSRNPPVDDATFLRRVSLELIGRNPTYAEASRFLDSKHPQKRDLLIQSLTGSAGYVSRHFNYWAEVLRAQSRQTGNTKNAWLNYLKKSIAENRPYDEWVGEMLAAEGSPWEHPEVGFFLRDTKNRLAGYEAMTAVFLGTEIGCAQCHDHPYEPISQLEYFQMYGYYVHSHPYGGRDRIYRHLDHAEVGTAVRELHKKHRQLKLKSSGKSGTKGKDEHFNIRRLWAKGFTSGKALGEIITSKRDTHSSRIPESYRYDDFKTKQHLPPEPIFGKTPPLKTKGEKPMAVFAEWTTHPSNLKFTHVIANRMWHKVMGAPLLGSLTNIQETENSVHPELMQYLAELMVSCEYDLAKFQSILMTTRTYQSEATPSDQVDENYAFPGPVLRRMSATQLWDSLLTLIKVDIDPPIQIANPDYAFLMNLRNAKTMEEYWTIIGEEVEKDVAAGRDEFGVSPSTRKGDRNIAKQGFHPERLRRASELPVPEKPGHFLRVFGQGERENVEDAWVTATIPQSLMLLNGNLHDEMANKDSAISKMLAETPDQAQAIRNLYLAVLSREPDPEEFALAQQLTSSKERNAYLRLLWILINTTEFVFQP